MERAWLVSDHKWSLGHERMNGLVAQKKFKKNKKLGQKYFWTIPRGSTPTYRSPIKGTNLNDKYRRSTLL